MQWRPTLEAGVEIGTPWSMPGLVPWRRIDLLAWLLSQFEVPFELALCSECGLITNVAFDARLTDYSTDYESTQQFSPTFRSFNHELARNLIDRYDVRGKTIIEIGCGQGEFLSLLCELGDNRRIGFDPAYAGRTSRGDSERLTFVQDFYSEKYAAYCADLYCCKMMLEHI